MFGFLIGIDACLRLICGSTIIRDESPKYRLLETQLSSVARNGGSAVSLAATDGRVEREAVPP